MERSRFDAVSRRFADRRLSRRQALAQAGAGVAAAGLATGLTGRALAQEASPVPAEPAWTETEFLFIQSFQQGSIAPKEGSDGRFTLTLEQGLGQTLYFSDRPDRIVGTTPTPDFLNGLGFPSDNPPNAALIVETETGEEAIAVVELFNPQYDSATHRATYEVQMLAEYDRMGITLQQDQADLATAHPTFGAAHLFIDDCADGTVACCSEWDYYSLECTNEYVGRFPAMGFCYSWWAGHCEPCEPYGHSIPPCKDSDNCPNYQYWEQKCNDAFGACNGICEPVFYG